MARQLPPGRLWSNCTHRDGETGPTCGTPATQQRIGLHRCDAHAADLWPCTAPYKLNGRRYCGIDHEAMGHIYGPVCRNPEPVEGVGS
ncbi:hypothetical protein [Kitasatospora sp. NPDC004289]